MMKFYADLFELTAESISAKSIRRLRWMTIGSLPYLPMIAYGVLYGLPRGYLALIFILFFVLCSVLTISVLLARIVNRVWSPDKYLDEWEKDLKRKSMTMAFMVVMYLALGMGVLWEFLNGYLTSVTVENPKAIPLLFVIGIVGVGFYTQIFTQLSLIDPMDEDELENDKYIKTSSRSVIGLIALFLVGILSIAFVLGFYNGHKSHDIEHAAAQDACGAAEVDTHKRSGTVIEVTCDGSDKVLRLDQETLKPL